MLDEMLLLALRVPCHGCIHIEIRPACLSAVSPQLWRHATSGFCTDTFIGHPIIMIRGKKQVLFPGGLRRRCWLQAACHSKEDECLMGDACLCKMQLPAPALPTASAGPASLAEPAQVSAGQPSTELPKSKAGEQRKVEETDKRAKDGTKKAKEDGKKAKEDAKKGEDTGGQS